MNALNGLKLHKGVAKTSCALEGIRQPFYAAALIDYRKQRTSKSGRSPQLQGHRRRLCTLFAPVTAIWLLAVPPVDTQHGGLQRTPVAERHQPVQGRSQASAPHPHRPGTARGQSSRADSPLRLNGGAFLLGSIGAAGWFRGVVENVLFYVAITIFAVYLAFTTLALRIIDARGR